MTLLVGMAQAAEPTVNSDLAFTDANFGGTPKAAIFFASNAEANNTSMTTSAFRFGFADGSAQAAIGFIAADARTSVQTTLTRNHMSSSYATLKPITGDSAGTPTTEATCAFSNNTATLTYTDVANAVLMHALLLGGDIECKRIYAAFPSGSPNNLAINHTLGGTPDLVIFFTGNYGADNEGSASASGTFGFWVSDGTHSGLYWANDTALTTTQMGLFASTTGFPAQGAETSKITVGSTSATQVVFNHSSTVATVYVYALVIRGTTSAVVAKTGYMSSSVIVETAAEVTGMSVAPKALLTINTQALAVNTAYINDSAASLGMGAAISNAGGTKQMQAGLVGDDALVLGNPTPTTDEHSWAHADRFIFLRGAGDAGTDISATVGSWDSGGITVSWDTVLGVARVFPYLLLGQATSAAAGSAKTVGKFGALLRGKLG